MVHPIPQARSLNSPFNWLRLAAVAIGFSVAWCAGQPAEPAVTVILLLLGCVMVCVYRSQVDYCRLPRDSAALWCAACFLVGWAVHYAVGLWALWSSAVGF